MSDPSGAAIVSATVTIIQSDTGFTRSVTTGMDGHYLIPSLRPAGYRLTVEAPGFRRFAQTGVTLQADQAATVNVKLEIGAATESVTVEASAVQVDTSTETLRQVVDNSRMIAMPLNGRNAAELTALVAGAVIAPPSQADQGKTKTFPVAVTISTNGTRQNQTSYRLDGAVRSECRWRGERRHEIRHESVSRRCLWISAKFRLERTKLLCFREGPAQAKSIRRNNRWTNQQG